MRWEDRVKRGLERVGEEWRTKAKNRRSWRPLIENVVRAKSGKKIRKTRTVTVATSPLTTGMSRREQQHRRFRPSHHDSSVRCRAVSHDVSL